MRSSSSVVIPGSTWDPTSSRAWAARRPAARIRSIVAASLTSLPSNGAGPGLPTYSGRAMWAGTARSGDTGAGATAGTPTSVVSSDERHGVLVLPDASHRRGHAGVQERRPPGSLLLPGRGLARAGQGRRAQRGLGQRPGVERRRAPGRRGVRPLSGYGAPRRPTRQPLSPWPVGGVIGLACVAFLIGATPVAV